MIHIRNFLLLVVLLCASTTVYLLITSRGPTRNLEYNLQPVPDSPYELESERISKDGNAHNSMELKDQSQVRYNFTPQDLHRQFAFSTDSPLDVLVFLHIQKTGGTTFGKNLVTNLDVRNPCQCKDRKKRKENSKLKCPCYASDGRRQWLFSRYSTGWMCGLHADYTEWMECLRSSTPDYVEGMKRRRRYLLLTVLRDPIERYISEFLHTNRGATWSGATLTCNGRSPTDYELPRCYKETWVGVKLMDFIHCPYNLANNRQTRMIANLSLVNCYENFSKQSHLMNGRMLESAKENLKSLAFFALKEFPNETQYLFEHTFNVKFKEPLGLLKPKTIHDSREYFSVLKQDIQRKIQVLNYLDLQLYEYAKQLFLARYQFATNWKSKLKPN